jgi:hypothetical protein
MQALLRYPRSQRRAVAQAWARRSHAAEAAARLARPPDAETERRRALDARRGQLVREGVTYRATGPVAWRITHSLHGRSDQYDIHLDGKLWRTGGPQLIRRWTHLRL